LLGVVSHDLKTPLNVILLTLELLRRNKSLDEPARHGLAAIERTARRMARLIRDLLDLASLQAGKLSVEKGATTFANIFREVEESHSSEARAKNIRLEFVRNVRSDRVVCDKDRIVQVLSNLVGNAVKFTPMNGHVAVQCSELEDEFLVVVQDDGPGISADDLPHIFDRFWRADRASALGTGLGLSISKGLVEAHGGSIYAESEPGKGSTFSFSLPRISRLAS
jgi:signal transduction histidine kinase